MAHHERVTCSVCRADVCACSTTHKSAAFPYVCLLCQQPPVIPVLSDEDRACLVKIAEQLRGTIKPAKLNRPYDTSSNFDVGNDVPGGGAA
jgi:hypothetical protein